MQGLDDKTKLAHRWYIFRLYFMVLSIYISTNNYTAPLGSNTSEPMLLIGNTVDPVTPLQRSVVLSLSSWDTILKR
jgi:hypothetical protein